MSIIAYLEISPRQTGKTSRLIETARRLLAAGTAVRFVCLKGMKADIQRQLPGALVMEDGEPFPLDHEPDTGAWFYDEFDWLKSTQVRKGGYYATTARFVRQLGEASADNDVLLQLIQAAGGRFERFYWPFNMGKVLVEARKLHTPKEFRLLYLGEFFA
ncbi:hypothetical protein [Pseudomonas sp. Marseille-Q8238]